MIKWTRLESQLLSRCTGFLSSQPQDFVVNTPRLMEGVWMWCLTEQVVISFIRFFSSYAYILLVSFIGTPITVCLDFVILYLKSIFLNHFSGLRYCYSENKACNNIIQPKNSHPALKMACTHDFWTVKICSQNNRSVSQKWVNSFVTDKLDFIRHCLLGVLKSR